jgi:hypothetical protein
VSAKFVGNRLHCHSRGLNCTQPTIDGQRAGHTFDTFQV